SNSPQSVSPNNCLMAEVAIGPLHGIGWFGSVKNPIDKSFRPYLSIGTILFLPSGPCEDCGFAPSTPNINGTEGPYISASSSPVLAPVFARARAKFAATVDFPTPPLPE